MYEFKENSLPLIKNQLNKVKNNSNTWHNEIRKTMQDRSRIQ
jgi:hypothetical protein